jgi:PRTRC genetic system protein E
MTTFEELFALASGASLALTISADAKTGRMTINVIPRPGKDADDPALTKALTLTATPQEFDEGFIAALKGYRETRQSLADQVEATREVLEAAKAASVKRATEASTKARPDKPGSPTPKVAPTTQPTPAGGTTNEASSDDDADASAGEPRAPAKNAGEVADLFG